MKLLVRSICLFLLVCVTQNVLAQSGILNPNDTVRVYNSAAPPTQPAYGQLGKWVKTTRMNWNTSSYKAYIYKGMAFRLKFPKSYQHGVADGKTYPIMVFFHGVGEKGAIYDNEFQLYHGGQVHSTAVDNGNFDGFLLYPQNVSGFFGATQYDFMKELIENFMVPQVKVDLNRVIIDGLSGGGTGSWDILFRHPKLIGASYPISAASVAYADNLNAVKYIPIWHFQGGLDNAPHPNTSKVIADRAALIGANYKYTVYPDQGHGCWYSAWAEPDFYPSLNRVHKANPYPLFGRTEFCPTDPINVKMGVTAGFDGYEWRKNGVVIPGATSNEITVTTIGKYDCRIKRGTVWSIFSPIPVDIKIKAATVSPPITVQGILSKVLPAPSGSTVKLGVPAGYVSYQWEKVGSSTIVSTTNTYDAPGAGEYRVKVNELYGCSSDFSVPFTVVDANGPNKPDPAINLTSTVLSKTEIRLNWSDNPASVNNETGFEVYQATIAGGPYKLVGVTAANATSFIASNLNSGSNYYFIVRAVNASGAAAPTSEIVATTQADANPPTAPLNLKATGTTRNSISLQWDAATDDVSVTKYDLYIDNKKAYVTEGTSFTVYNLEQGRTYNFTVRARDFAGNQSPFSNQITTQPVLNGLNYKYYTGTWSVLPDFNTLTPAATGITTNVSIAPRTVNDNFGFLWEGFVRIPVTGTYTFRTNSDDGSKLYLGQYSQTATALVNNDGLHGGQDRDGTITLTAGVYPIAVTFFEAGGGESIVVSWRTPQTNNAFTIIPDTAFNEKVNLPGTAPAAPSGLTATASSYKSIILNWTDNSNNETAFEIYRSTSATTGFNTVARAASGTSTFTDTTLTPNTRYYYKIRAVGAYGESAFDKAGGGVAYSYYEVDGMSVLPNFNVLNPVKTGTVAQFGLGMQNRGDNFAVKLQSVITVPTSGTYTFYTSSDDGSKLYIGGFTEANLVVNNDGAHGTTEKSGIKVLTAGVAYPIYVTFFEAGGGEVLEVRYSRSGLTKQIIPANILGEAFANAITNALPGTPLAPTALSASRAGTTAINIAWTDNATNEDGFKLYRSANDVNNFVVLKTLPANTAQFSDTGLFSNAVYYYKVKAYNVGTESTFSNEDSAKTGNNLPVLAAVENQFVRFGTTLNLPVSATDVDGEQLTFSISGSPAFGEISSSVNGNATITFNPQLADLGTFQDIMVKVTDQNGGEVTRLFTLVVNDNFNPQLSAVSNQAIAEKITGAFTVSATDQNASDQLTWSFTDLPAFITPAITAGSVTFNMAPDYSDNGLYKIKIRIEDGRSGFDTLSVVVNVTDVNPDKKIFINFTDGSMQGSGVWNNTNKIPALNDVFANMKDATGANSGISLTVTSSWQGVGNGTNVLGATTGNNSGVYPDSVIRSSYWSNTTQQSLKISGLSPTSKYSFTFFGSRGGVTDNRTSVYTINGNSVSLNAAGNTKNTVTMTNVVPLADGTVMLYLKNGVGSSFSYLNAMIIELKYDDGTVPAKPRNLSASLDNGKIKLGWTDASYNESGYSVHRATAKSGPYTLITASPLPSNTVALVDSAVTGNNTYFYYVVASNTVGTSLSSDTATIAIPNTAPVIASIANVAIKNNETSTINIQVNDDPSDIVSIRGFNLPSFVSVVDNGNKTAVININPLLTSVGQYQDIEIRATDNAGASSSVKFNLIITDKDITAIYVNFNQLLPVSGKWNSFNNTPVAGRNITNLKDESGVGTGVAITLMETWNGANDVGATTGDNSGIFEDNVMQTAFYENTTNPKRIRITGLSAGLNRYNLIFFGSRIASDNRNTTYTAGGTSVTLNAAGNTSKTVQINGLVADSTGTIEFVVTKGTGSPYSYLNALVIQKYVDNGSILSPSNLKAAGKSRNSIQVSWNDNSSNETGFEVYRSSTIDGQYSLLTTTAANTTSYTNSALSVNTTYYYKVRAVATGLQSSYSNISGASTYSWAVYVNFNRDFPAAAPWNNTNTVPQEGDMYTNLKNDQGNVSGLGVGIVDNFSGENPSGMNTGNNSGIYPDNVIRSSYWVDRGDRAEIKVTGLNQSMVYSFVFFGSRDGGGDRTSVYTINGQSVSLNASFNISQTAQIDQVRPDENGEIYISITLGAGSQFAYLGSLVIQAADAPDEEMPATTSTVHNKPPTTVQQPLIFTEVGHKDEVAVVRPTITEPALLNGKLTAYPNPFTDRVSMIADFSKDVNKLTIRVMDLNGRLLHLQVLSDVKKGRWTYNLSLGQKVVQPGMYILQITADDSKKSESFKLLRSK
jgi:chitodextrinase